MSVSSTGACPGTATDATSLQRESTSSMRASSTYVLSGITAGSHTFRACYRKAGAGGDTAIFADRSIIVMPLP